MPTYNKLVRDKIPTMIEKIGKQCRTSILTEKDFEKKLKAKLKEELAELLAAETSKDVMEEMAADLVSHLKLFQKDKKWKIFRLCLGTVVNIGV